jgi:hypothetical protein
LISEVSHMTANDIGSIVAFYTLLRFFVFAWSNSQLFFAYSNMNFYFYYDMDLHLIQHFWFWTLNYILRIHTVSAPISKNILSCDFLCPHNKNNHLIFCNILFLNYVCIYCIFLKSESNSKISINIKK